MSNQDTRDFVRPEGLYLKFSEPMMEPHTPVIIERVNGDCTVSQFIIARDEAHELINQLCEFLRVAVPAATQEQPAGSEASESSMIAFEKTWQQLKHQMEYEEETLQRVPNDWPLEKRTAYWMYLSVIEDGWEAGKIACMSADPTATHHKWPTVRNRAEAEALRSPRKVGEDGEPEKYERTHSRVWTNAWNEALEKVCELVAVNGDKLEFGPFSIGHNPKRLLQEHTMIVELIRALRLRSSSVPVGEQKQEEGV